MMMNHVNVGKIKNLGYVLTVSLLGFVAGSALADGAPSKQVDFSKIPDAVPKVESKSKGGGSYVIKGKRYSVMNTAKGYDQTGQASWYGTQFHGRKTASGEVYNLYAPTAASPSLPLNTYLKVTNLENGRSMIVKVTDRGPYAKGRILDLSYAAAQKLGYANKGTAKIRATAIDPLEWTNKQA